MKKIIILIVALLILGLAYYFSADKNSDQASNELNTDEQSTSSTTNPNANPNANPNTNPNTPNLPNNSLLASPSVFVENINVPWNISFLPDGNMILTERTGTLKIIDKGTKNILSEIEVPGVVQRGEGGLMGLALHPNFSTNKYIYLYFTTNDGTKEVNRVTRYYFDGKKISQNKIIVDNIPAGTNHNGGRIAFGPDKLLYITTGDAGNEYNAQDKNSLAGKILRVSDEGVVPQNNPYQTLVYSLGHRNPQGIAWDSGNNLWSTEHGRSGFQSGLDEINLIEKGGNYGWPIIEGDEKRDGMISPIVHSGTSKTWAPSGIAIYKNKIYFAGLRGQALYEVSIISKGKLGAVVEKYKEKYGRLRAVTVSGDGNIYFGTSNRDGRGKIKAGDDKILVMKIKI